MICKYWLRTFIIFFLASMALHTYWLMTFDLIDGSLWGTQAELVQSGDPRQYDPKLAYIPPGGPTILGTIALRDIGIPSHTAALLFTALFDSLAIAAIALLCHLLSRSYMWPLLILFTLSFNRLIENATPPSLSVSILSVLLFTLTVYMLNDSLTHRRSLWMWWGVVSGLSISLRPEVGLLITAIFGALLSFELRKNIPWYSLGVTVISALVTFVVTDPFMWSIPLQHIRDVVTKVILFHGTTDSTLSFAVLRSSHFWSLTCLAWTSMILALIGLKLLPPKDQIITQKAVYALYAITAIFFVGLLSSQNQAARYFLPVIFIWETLLPLYLLSFVSQIARPSPRILKWCIVLLVIGFQMAIFYVLY